MKKWTKTIMNKYLTGHARIAYFRWCHQKGRCYNNTNPDYKTYGEKGIKVEYSSRDFINWYINQPLHLFKKPVVGRIDHDKNYSFDNIEILEASDNSIERINRLGSPAYFRSKPVWLINKKGKKLIKWSSFKEAAKDLKISDETVRRSATFNKITIDGFRFTIE